MSFLDYFVKKPKPFTGAILDVRTPEEKAKTDIKIEEIVASAISVNWIEKKPEEIRFFGDQDQHQTYQCVAESRRKLKRILFKVNKNIDLDFSSIPFYRSRSNYPFPGMNAIDAISLDKTLGMTLDVLVPSESFYDENKVNSYSPEKYVEDVAKNFTISEEIVFTPGDLDKVAGTIQITRKGVMMWFYFTSDEWSREVPVLIDKPLEQFDTRALRHSVVGVEPALYKGQEGIWVDDSAHFGGLPRRFITREVYERRNIWASYPISFKFEPPVHLKPSYDESVKSLQDCLKYEGLFPTNVDSTGLYGPLTTKAVKDFQKKYNLEQVGTIGPKTLAKLKELYP